MSKDAYYFSHDSNARYDPKILAMRAVYGMEGYGRYWCLIEILRDEDGYKLEKTKHLYDALAMQMQCDRNAAHDFVDACINEFGLLREDDEFIWSDSLIKRMENKNKKSEKARKAAQKRWKKSSYDADSMPSQSDKKAVQSVSNADAMQTHSERNALKESKGKESKRKESTKRSCRANKFADEHMDLAQKMLALIKQNNPSYKSPASLDGWANEIRLMVERDHRTLKQIDYLISWSQKDDFWSMNCLSPASLRKHFDQMVLQCKKQKLSNHPRDGNIVPIDKRKQAEYEKKYGF